MEGLFHQSTSSQNVRDLKEAGVTLKYPVSSPKQSWQPAGEGSMQIKQVAVFVRQIKNVDSYLYN